MEVRAMAWARKVLSQEEYLVNEAYFTFVAMDEYGKPAEIPAVKPRTKEETQLFRSALERRKKRMK
jgi:acyl-CoA hydrolase